MSDPTMPLRPPAPPTPSTRQKIASILLNLVILAALLYVFLWVIGLMIGLLATSLIQSSSSSTSIVVGLVSGGALTVQGAIPIIMGANMGTTVTNTLVAMTSMNRRKEFQLAFAGATMHDFFNLLAIMILFRIEQATLGLADGLTTIVMVILALAGIFFALTFLTRVLKGLVLEKAEGSFTDRLNRSGMAAMFMGLLVTVGVQSSSITTSLLVPLEAAFAATLGANIGTTVTALLASLTGSPQAVTVALVHLLFNVTGILIIYPIKAIRHIPIRLATGLAARVARKRSFAFIHMIGVFFALPLVFVMIDKMVRS